MNESFIEADSTKDKSGLSYRNKMEFDKMMKKSSIHKLLDFENKYLDSLSDVYSKYKKVDWLGTSDVEFAVELDKFIKSVHRSLKHKILEVNGFSVKCEYLEFIKVISIETLSEMKDDFIQRSKANKKD